MNNNVITALAAVAGAGVGAAVAHILTKRALTKRFDAEIEDVKENYRPTLFRNAEGRLLFPDGVGPANSAEDNYKHAQDIIRNYEFINGLGYANDDAKDPEEVDEDGVTTEIREDDEQIDFPSGNIFDNRIAHGSYDIIPGEPYLISLKEFEEAEPEYETGSLNWYVHDETLADNLTENGNAEIDNVDYVIGSRHLEMFGKWSEDKNVIYVRNENISTKYEVTRIDGSYEQIVLGLEPGNI